MLKILIGITLTSLISYKIYKSYKAIKENTNTESSVIKKHASTKTDKAVVIEKTPPITPIKQEQQDTTHDQRCQEHEQKQNNNEEQAVVVKPIESRQKASLTKTKSEKISKIAMMFSQEKSYTAPTNCRVEKKRTARTEIIKNDENKIESYRSTSNSNDIMGAGLSAKDKNALKEKLEGLLQGGQKKVSKNQNTVGKLAVTDLPQSKNTSSQSIAPPPLAPPPPPIANGAPPPPPPPNGQIKKPTWRELQEKSKSVTAKDVQRHEVSRLKTNNMGNEQSASMLRELQEKLKNKGTQNSTPKP